MVLSAVVLGRFADEPLPASYLIRPLLLVGVLALVLGLASQVVGTRAPGAAAVAAVLIIAPDFRILLIVGFLVAAELLRPQGREGELLIIVFTAVLFVVGFVRAVQVIQVFPEGPEVVVEETSVYVLLVDGYPRIDTLASLGIDNRPFVDALNERGFDHYPDATSLHSRTNKTLLAMVSDEPVTDEPNTVEERRAIRGRLVVPEGFVVVDPPVGYVTMGPGRHLDPGGVNDFEAQLVAESILAIVAPDWAWSVLLESLRDRLDDSLELVESTGEARVFAHLMAPHPPFLYGPDGSVDVPRGCWPGCGLFAYPIERLLIDEKQWAAGMAAQLEHLNGQLLQTIDALLARDPDAVIVLVSDHGGRYSLDDREEMRRPFLAARTPGHPRLFSANPRPDAVFRVISSAYP
jgi:hypothetical protein